MSIILKKYSEVLDYVTPPHIFYQTIVDDYDIEDYFIKESLDISKSVEIDTTFNLSASYGSLNFIKNDILTEQFTAANFKGYLFGIEIKDVDGRSFAGQVDAENTYYDEIERVWVIALKDWIKHHIDILKQKWWEVTYSNLSDFLYETFLGQSRVGGFYSVIQGIEIKVRDNSNWDIADQEYILWKGKDPNVAPYNEGDYLKTHTLYDLLIEAQKHYGAYFFVDENLKLNFVNTQYLTAATDITYLIYNNNFTKIPYQPEGYNGILISQEEQISDIETEVSWRMLRYINGEIEVTKILSEAQLEDLPKGLSLLDIRQNLGWTEKTTAWDGHGSHYEKKMRMGYEVFPQRAFDDTLADYTYVLKPVIKWECIIKPTNLPLFSLVSIDGITYQLYEAKLDGVSNEDSLTIRRTV